MIDKSVFDEFPVLKTKRLTMREILDADALAIYTMRANGMVNRFISRNNMNTPDEAKNLVERTRAAYTNKQGIGWAGILRQGEQIIGTCGFNMIDFNNNLAEIGGELSTEYWGKNIALEAVSAIVEFGFKEMNLHRIEARLSPENRGAIYILEQLGFQKEGQFRDRVYFNQKYSDMSVYAVLSDEVTFPHLL